MAADLLRMSSPCESKSMQDGNHILLYPPFFFFGRTWALNSRLHTCIAGALLLDPHFQSTLLWLFWRWGLGNYLPRLDSNCYSPDLASQVARIAGVSHQNPARTYFLMSHLIASASTIFCSLGASHLIARCISFLYLSYFS
jgi:hypothetical protein